MATRLKAKKVRGGSRIVGPNKVTLRTLSLPPGDDGAAPASSTSPIPATQLPIDGTLFGWRPGFLPGDDSVIKEKALKIVALRLVGRTEDEIADLVGLSRRTLKQYVYTAGKLGWLEHFEDAKDAVESVIEHRVIRNLTNFLDSPDEQIRLKTTLATAEGTLFKKFTTADVTALPPAVLVGVRIEQVGAPVTIREDTIGGVPAYLDADVD